MDSLKYLISFMEAYREKLKFLSSDLDSVKGSLGSTWFQGTTITGKIEEATIFANSGIVSARLHDKYFNTDTSDVYNCVSPGDSSVAEWIWIGNLGDSVESLVVEMTQEEYNALSIEEKEAIEEFVLITDSEGEEVFFDKIVYKDTTIEFTEPETMANIESGESILTIFGKLRKVVGNLLAGAASTLLGVKLTANKVLLSDANGNVGVSEITSTELGYLDGVTKNIQEQFSEQNANFGGLTFAKDASGAWGYKVGGADPVIPFKQKQSLILIGSISGNGTINCTSIKGYEKLSANDFLISITKYSTSVTSSTGGGNIPTGRSFSGIPGKSYNPSTGVLTLSGCVGSLYDSPATMATTLTVDVYLK